MVEQVLQRNVEKMLNLNEKRFRVMVNQGKIPADDYAGQYGG
jgi:hypothetical protein